MLACEMGPCSNAIEQANKTNEKHESNVLAEHVLWTMDSFLVT